MVLKANQFNPSTPPSSTPTHPQLSVIAPAALIHLQGEDEAVSQADAGDKKFNSHLAAPTFQSPSLQRATAGFSSLLRCRLL
jgi:hypothetical protein